MAIASDTDIDNIYGKDNVDKWADRNNKGSVDGAAEILAVRSWARHLAEARINGKLKDGPYRIPFTDEGSGFDLNIIDLMAREAGVLLYDSRRITDTDEESVDALSLHRRMVIKFIAEILSGRLKLIGHTNKAVRFPQTVDLTE